MLDYLNAEIERRQNEIAKIETERHKLDQRRHDLGIELRTYEDVRARLAHGRDDLQKAKEGLEPSHETVVGTSATMIGSTRSKLAAHWQVVLRAAVERYPEVVKNSEVGTIQRSAGHDPSRSMNIRTHLHKLREEGLYERVDRGAVRATQAAAELLGIPLGTNAELNQSMAASDLLDAAGEKRRDMPTKPIPPLLSLTTKEAQMEPP